MLLVHWQELIQFRSNTSHTRGILMMMTYSLSHSAQKLHGRNFPSVCVVFALPVCALVSEREEWVADVSFAELSWAEESHRLGSTGGGAVFCAKGWRRAGPKAQRKHTQRHLAIN